jgi:hypothetical protein
MALLIAALNVRQAAPLDVHALLSLPFVATYHVVAVGAATRSICLASAFTVEVVAVGVQSVVRINANALITRVKFSPR